MQRPGSFKSARILTFLCFSPERIDIREPCERNLLVPNIPVNPLPRPRRRSYGL